VRQREPLPQAANHAPSVARFSLDELLQDGHVVLTG